MSCDQDDLATHSVRQGWTYFSYNRLLSFTTNQPSWLKCPYSQVERELAFTGKTVLNVVVCLQVVSAVTEWTLLSKGFSLLKRIPFFLSDRDASNRGTPSSPGPSGGVSIFICDPWSCCEEPVLETLLLEKLLIHCIGYPTRACWILDDYQYLTRCYAPRRLSTISYPTCA